MLESCPYKGLVPFSEEDAPYFFGRDRERRQISAALRASRLTVLYGESGAGKTSVLAAGVAHDLRDDPDYTFVLFRNWRDDPMRGLLSTIRDRMSNLPGFIPNGEKDASDSSFALLRRWSEQTRRSLLIVLDQFEEYFQYHPSESGTGKLAEELPRLLNHSDLLVNVVISLREDTLGSLDRFKGAIPSLFDNLVRVEHLTKKSAEEAIIKPLKKFEQELRTGKTSEGKDSLRPSQVAPDVAKNVVEEIVRTQGGEGDRVQAPYLQLVMTRWWEADVGSQLLRPETLKSLGGVHTIVERYLEDTLTTLVPHQKEILAEVFRYMVTPSGRKIAQTTSELMGVTALGESVSSEILDSLLEHLVKARVLTHVPPPRGSGPQEKCYEFAHDVIAKAAFDWRKEFYQARQLAETRRKEKEDEAWRRAEEQARQARRLRVLAIALGTLLFVAIGASILALWARTEARARELVSASLLTQTTNPEFSVWNAAQAVATTWPWGHKVLPEAEPQLHSAVMASHIKLTITGHAGAVGDVAWSPDGKRLASAGEDKTVKIWDAETGNGLFTLKAHTDSVLRVAWSPDGKRLASAGEDGTVKLWNIEAGREQLTLKGQTESVLSVGWSPDGKRLATAGYDGTAKLWDAETGKFISAPIKHNRPVWDVAWSPDGRRLAAAVADKTAEVWDAGTGKKLLTLKGHADSVSKIAWSLDGQRLATASADNTCKIWDAATGSELLSLGGKYTTSASREDNSPYIPRPRFYGVLSVAWSPDGKRLATGGENSAKVWDARTGELVVTLNGHDDIVRSVAWSPNGLRLATASNDKTIKIWVPERNKELLLLTGHTDSVNLAAWSPDGKMLATASEDHTARVWDEATGEQLLTLEGHTDHVSSIAWSPDGKRLATASDDATAKLWDASTGSTLLTLKGHRDSVWGVAWSPDGKRLATASVDATAKEWDAETGKVLFTFSGNDGLIRNVAWSPDGKRLATANADATAKLWDANTGSSLLTLKGHRDSVWSVAWSPDGKRLATGSLDRTAKIWDLGTGKALFTLSGHNGFVEGVAWSPDGMRLATASADNTAKVWEGSTGKELMTLGGHSRFVLGVAWSPNGKRLATAGEDSIVQIYTMDIRDLMALARQRVTAQPAAEECKKYLRLEQCPPFPELPRW